MVRSHTARCTCSKGGNGPALNTHVHCLLADRKDKNCTRCYPTKKKNPHFLLSPAKQNKQTRGGGGQGDSTTSVTGRKKKGKLHCQCYQKKETGIVSVTSRKAKCNITVTREIKVSCAISVTRRKNEILQCIVFRKFRKCRSRQPGLVCGLAQNRLGAECTPYPRPPPPPAPVPFPLSPKRTSCKRSSCSITLADKTNNSVSHGRGRGNGGMGVISG